MMIGLIAATFIRAEPIIIAGPAGPPYYPSPSKPAETQGLSACVCGPHPQEGQTTSIQTGEWGQSPTEEATIVGLAYRGNQDHFNYTVQGMLGDPQNRENGNLAPYGCYEIVMVERWNIAAGGGVSGTPTPYNVYYQAPTPMNQPGCLFYDPPCPSIRIQGMPGQTIRVRCKGDECTDTNGTEPKR